MKLLRKFNLKKVHNCILANKLQLEKRNVQTNENNYVNDDGKLLCFSNTKKFDKKFNITQK